MNDEVNPIRTYLSPHSQQLFDDIVFQRVLGASAHIKMISQMIRDLCSTARVNNETTDSLDAKIHQLAGFFIKNRGEASQAVTNVLEMITKNSNKQIDRGLNSYIEFIHNNIDDFEKYNKQNLDLINKYAQSVLSRMNTILLFDYSSTVGKMIETCDHPLEIIIAESRALNGGRPYISQALIGDHKVHFIPDVAIYHYIKNCDGIFIGAETFNADGKVYITVGTDMVACLSNIFDVPFYVLTTLVKIDMRSIYGFDKTPLMLDLRSRISTEVDNHLQEKIDYSCPELVEVPSKWITAYITEVGIVPPSALFHLSMTFLENGVITKHA